MTHENERTCVITHARHIIHAKIHAHAHAACGPIPVTAVSIDTFSGEEMTAEGAVREPNVPEQ